MNTFVWVYGSSAVGKETFIKKLVESPPQNVIEYLGWRGKKIISIPESLQYIGQFENDPITLKRAEIITRAKSIGPHGNTVALIKGQDVDLARELPTKLRNEIPEAQYEIIFLHSDLETLFNRSRKKKWWTQEMEEEGVEEFKRWLIEEQLDPLTKLAGFKFSAFDSTTPDYRPISFPPEIK